MNGFVILRIYTVFIAGKRFLENTLLSSTSQSTIVHFFNQWRPCVFTNYLPWCMLLKIYWTKKLFWALNFNAKTSIAASKSLWACHWHKLAFTILLHCFVIYLYQELDITYYQAWLFHKFSNYHNQKQSHFCSKQC